MSMDSQTQDRLCNAALLAAKRAYAPYSNFFVGAAILLDSGEIVSGCNVENASYGLAICAERVAIGSMVAGGDTRFAAIAVASRGGVTPCGACRQVLSEFGLEFDVLLVDSESGKHHATWKMADLLPGAFKLEL